MNGACALDPEVRRMLTKTNKALAKVGLKPVVATEKGIDGGFKAVDKLLDAADEAGECLINLLQEWRVTKEDSA